MYPDCLGAMNFKIKSNFSYLPFHIQTERKSGELREGKCSDASVEFSFLQGMARNLLCATHSLSHIEKCYTGYSKSRVTGVSTQNSLFFIINYEMYYFTDKQL